MVESLSNNADKSDVDAEVEDHRAADVHDDPQPPQTHDNSAHSANYASSGDVVDTRRSVNQLIQQNAEQDFELGLSMLDYQDGQYEIFATDDNVTDSSDLSIRYGSELDNAGVARLQSASIGDISTGAEVTQVQDTDIMSAEADPVNGHVYAGTRYDDVFKLDAGDLSELATFDQGGRVTGLAVDGGNQFGYSGGSEGVVRKWDTDTLSEQASFSGHGGDIEAVVIDPDGVYGYSIDGEDPGEVIKWDTDTLSEQASYTLSTDGVDVDIDLQNGFVYVIDSDGVVTKLGVSDLSEQETFTDHTIGGVGVAVDPSTGFGYSADSDGVVKKWSLDTLSEESSYSAGGGDAVELAVSTNTGEGALAQDDGLVSGFDLSDMTEIGTFTEHSEYYNLYSITIDGINGFGYSGDDIGEFHKWGEGIAAATDGSVQHTFQDLGFVPTAAVLNDEIGGEVPADADVYYQIEDDDGNSQTIQRSDVDSTVELDGFTSSSVSTTAFIERDDITVESPELDAWALYLTDQ